MPKATVLGAPGKSIGVKAPSTPLASRKPCISVAADRWRGAHDLAAVVDVEGEGEQDAGGFEFGEAHRRSAESRWIVVPSWSTWTPTISPRSLMSAADVMAASGTSIVVNRPLSHRKPWNFPSASVYSPTT